MNYSSPRSLCAVALLTPLLSVLTYAQAFHPPTQHVRDAVRNGQARLAGRLPSNQTLSLDLVLPLKDSAGLDAFLKDIYNLSSPNFHHYLTPSEFTQRFGATQANYDAVVNFAKSNGLTVVDGSLDRRLVQVKGSVLAVEQAFNINLNLYQHPTEDRTFYSPDREPSVTVAISHITGLDNYSIPKPRLVSRSDYASAHNIDVQAVVSHATTGSGPSASYLGSDMRAAYYGGTLTGAGQYVGLWEYVGTNLADVTTYYTNIHQTNTVPISLVATDSTSTSCSAPGCDDTEQTLDITQVLGMAPGLSGLVVFVGSSDTAIISKMVSSTPLVSTIGCSWGWTPADPSTLDIYFKQMAAQGQTFLAASGDASTWTKSGSSAPWPADDANVVAVGGTDLVTASAGGAWASETAWLDSGGGISPDSIAIPSWQTAAINSTNKGSTTLRNGPDVSANANFTFYVCADQKACSANSYGGTSFAAPMWAGLLALANQQASANKQPNVGFINPNIYSENASAATYAANFHDITSGTSGSYSAVAGFDLVTGWGSPNGQSLINSLVAAANSPTLTVAASPSAVSVVAGSSGASSITTSIAGGFNSAVALTVSGAPTGVTASLSSGGSIAAPGNGSLTLTLAVASTTAAGTYPITVTAKGANLTATTTVTLTVTTPGSGSFTLSVSPTAGSLRHGSSGYANVTTKVSGGFSSAITFASTGTPSGVTASFSPASIAAPGSGSTEWIISAPSNAPKGTYTLTVTATGGSKSASATLTLTIN